MIIVIFSVFNFQYGRVDCDTAPSTDANVGHPPGDLDHDGEQRFQSGPRS